MAICHPERELWVSARRESRDASRALSMTGAKSRWNTSARFATRATRLLHLDVKERRSSAPCNKQGAIFSWRRQAHGMRNELKD